MKRFAGLVAAFSLLLSLAMPFIGGGGPSLFAVTLGQATVPVVSTQSVPEAADEEERAVPEVAPVGTRERRAAIESAGLTCPSAISGVTASAPGRSAADGRITATTTDDLADFAAQYNAIRVANCLQPVPLANFRYDACMEDRLLWMAEDPSDDPLSAWGHIGSVRSDGVPSVGCDGNLAGGSGDSGASVADKWWGSASHRDSLYQPTYEGAVAGVCILFAATHGGVGATVDESPDFTRAAARWASC